MNVPIQFSKFKTLVQVGGICLLTLWYVLVTTQLGFVFMDVIAPAVVVEQAAPDCAAMGCGCNVNDPDRICCCTGKTVGETHSFEATVSDLPSTLSYLAASYCAGGFPDQDGVKSASSIHMLATAPLLLLTLCFLFSFPFPASNFPNWKADPPDKIPI